MKVSEGYVVLGKWAFAILTLIYLTFLLDTVFDFSWTKNPTNLADWMIPNIGFLIFIALSVYLIAYDKYMVLYNDKKIIFHGIFGQIKEINWKDITKVTFFKQGLRFYIYDKDNKIHVDKHTSGFVAFVEKLKSNVEAKITEKALVDLSETAGR